MSIKNKVVAAACGFALTASVFVPAAAFGFNMPDSENQGNTLYTDTNRGDTDVYIKVAETAGPDGSTVQQLNFSIPSRITFATEGSSKYKIAAGDLKIINGSAFPLRMKNVNIQKAIGWNFVQESFFGSALSPNVVTDSTPNALYFAFNNAGNTAVNSISASQGGLDIDPLTMGSWEVPVNGSLTIGAYGCIANVDKNLSNDGVQAATITWTLEASGNN